MRRGSALLVALGLALSACGRDSSPPAATTALTSSASPSVVGEAAPPSTAVGASEPGATPPELPEPDGRIPRGVRALTQELEATVLARRAAVNDWIASGGTGEWPPPAEVELLVLHEQRIYRLLAAYDRLADRVLARVPAHLRANVRANVAAGAVLHDHFRPVDELPDFKTRAPEPADVLLRHFLAAEDRFGVAWEYLAAVMLIETRMGRIVSSSSAGAQGPMQFLPATWAAYGVDGDGDGDRDPRDYRDAIPAAARYLCASGAPGDISGALWHYNHADWYVAQVLEQARAYTAEPAPAGPLGPGLPGLPAAPGSLAAIPRVGQGDPAEYDGAYSVGTWACCTCSAASLTAVARGFGRPVRIADTMRLMPGAITTRLGLVNRPALVGAARALGLRAADDVIGYEHLRAATAAGQPVLLDITNGTFPDGHWLVVTGVGDDGVRVIDSAGTRLTFIARSTFVPSWSGRGIRLAG
jgi:Transglycosylase SLT domain